MIRYWMHGTRAIFSRYLLPLPFLLFLPTSAVSTVSNAFFLVAVTGMEVTKTNTSFWLFFQILKAFVRVISPFKAIEVFDLRDVFSFLLNDINVSTYCRGVMITTLSLSPVVLKTTSLAVLVFFANFTLVDGRLLRVLATNYISGRGIRRQIFFRVFFFLLRKLLPLETLGINLLGT